LDKYTELFVNEYHPGDQLQFHHDHRSTYKEVIFGISLLCDCFMTFKLNKKELRVEIPARSLYLMTGDSRIKWKHGLYAGTLTGERRVSLTFRTANYQ